jgi:hypothetical protein
MITRIGPQMSRAAAIVAANPGCTKLFVAERITPHPIPSKNWKLGYEPINRAIRAGLIKATYSAGRYSLTAADSEEGDK